MLKIATLAAIVLIAGNAAGAFAPSLISKSRATE
jgi:hypothetical protein